MNLDKIIHDNFIQTNSLKLKLEKCHNFSIGYHETVLTKSCISMSTSANNASTYVKICGQMGETNKTTKFTFETVVCPVLEDVGLQKQLR